MKMMSLKSASVAPRPIAWPFTFAMIGLGQSSNENTIRLVSLPATSNRIGSSIMRCMPSKPPPAEKALPAPVRIATSHC